MRVGGIIPARYHSTRLDGKVLADIAGKPMVQWVYERACSARALSEVTVATDDERVAGLHAADEPAQVPHRGPFDGAHVLVLDVLRLRGVPEIGIVEGRALVVVVRRPVAPHGQVRLEPAVIDRGRVQDGTIGVEFGDQQRRGRLCERRRRGQHEQANEGGNEDGRRVESGSVVQENHLK